MQVLDSELEVFRNGKFNALCDFVLRQAKAAALRDDPQFRMAMEALGELQGLNRRANPEAFVGGSGGLDIGY